MDNKSIHQNEDLENVETEEIFQLGLKAWEGFKQNSDFETAKKYIGEAKSRGHDLADMYWDIICAFEDAAKES